MSCDRETRYYSIGDTLPTIEATLLSCATGSGADLTGATVAFKMEDSTGTIVVNAAAVIVDAGEGIVSYTFVPNELSTAGDYKYKFTVTFAGGGVRSWPPSGGNDLTVSDF